MRIPVIILSGFLGSGKTTLLLNLLEETGRRGWKPGILINELGKQDVDGRIVGERTDAALRLLMDGCVCCSRKSELAGCLEALLDREPDLLIIELTGVANPEEIAAAMAEPAFRGRLATPTTATVLDAEFALEYASMFASDRQLVRTLRRQLEAADWIVVNKTDLVAPDRLDKIDRMARKHNSRARLIRTVRCRLDAGQLLDLPARSPVHAAQAGSQLPLTGTRARRNEPVGSAGTAHLHTERANSERTRMERAHTEHLHTERARAEHSYTERMHTEHSYTERMHTERTYTERMHTEHSYTERMHTERPGTEHSHTVHAHTERPKPGDAQHKAGNAGLEAASFGRLQTFTLSCPPSYRMARSRLEQWFAAWSRQLVRAKGYIPTEDGDGLTLVQHAGSRTSWERSSYPGSPYLVVIGNGLDERDIKAQWASLLERPDEPARDIPYPVRKG